jgi:DNA-binding CsgD family transcriptional regulator
MLQTQQTKLIDQIQTFFKSNYTAPAGGQLDEDVKNLLEHPLLKQFIFANNQITVIDHAIGGYRYTSESIHDVMGYPASEFMKNGVSFALGLMHPDDLLVLRPVFEEVTSLVKQVSVEERPYFRFNYSVRFRAPTGYRLLYQQNIPLAFNEAGLPYLLIALVSDITSYAKNDGVHYSISVNVPGKPIRHLLSSRSATSNSPLTERENEIVQHLANGLDTNEIAKKLFISEGTVRKHRQNILEKTEAKNSVHLVRLAVANGWV